VLLLPFTPLKNTHIIEKRIENIRAPKDLGIKDAVLGMQVAHYHFPGNFIKGQDSMSIVNDLVAKASGSS
jgi:hypothetical protein